MRNDTRRNKPERPSGSSRKPGTAGKKALGRDKPQHTASERDRMETGLRILARIIARAHLRRQAFPAATELPPDQETGE